MILDQPRVSATDGDPTKLPSTPTRMNDREVFTTLYRLSDRMAEAFGSNRYNEYHKVKEQYDRVYSNYPDVIDKMVQASSDLDGVNPRQASMFKRALPGRMEQLSKDLGKPLTGYRDPSRPEFWQATGDVPETVAQAAARATSGSGDENDKTTLRVLNSIQADLQASGKSIGEVGSAYRAFASTFSDLTKQGDVDGALTLNSLVTRHGVNPTEARDIYTKARDLFRQGVPDAGGDPSAPERAAIRLINQVVADSGFSGAKGKRTVARTLSIAGAAISAIGGKSRVTPGEESKFVNDLSGLVSGFDPDDKLDEVAERNGLRGEDVTRLGSAVMILRARSKIGDKIPEEQVRAASKFIQRVLPNGDRVLKALGTPAGSIVSAYDDADVSNDPFYTEISKRDSASAENYKAAKRSLRNADSKLYSALQVFEPSSGDVDETTRVAYAEQRRDLLDTVKRASGGDTDSLSKLQVLVKKRKAVNGEDSPLNRVLDDAVSQMKTASESMKGVGGASPVPPDQAYAQLKSDKRNTRPADVDELIGTFVRQLDRSTSNEDTVVVAGKSIPISTIPKEFRAFGKARDVKESATQATDVVGQAVISVATLGLLPDTASERLGKDVVENMKTYPERFVRQKKAVDFLLGSGAVSRDPKTRELVFDPSKFSDASTRYTAEPVENAFRPIKWGDTGVEASLKDSEGQAAMLAVLLKGGSADEGSVSALSAALSASKEYSDSRNTLQSLRVKHGLGTDFEAAKQVPQVRSDFGNAMSTLDLASLTGATVNGKPMTEYQRRQLEERAKEFADEMQLNSDKMQYRRDRDASATSDKASKSALEWKKFEAGWTAKRRSQDAAGTGTQTDEEYRKLFREQYSSAP